MLEKLFFWCWWFLLLDLGNYLPIISDPNYFGCG